MADWIYLGSGRGWIRLTKRLEHPIVRADRSSQCGVIVVRDVVALGYLPYNPGNCRIVDAADLREKMMFNLVIESTDVSLEHFVAMSKVGRGQHFVNQPCVLHVAIIIRAQVLRSLYHMSQLENDPEDQSSRQVHGQESDQELPPGDVEEPERENNHVQDNNCLGDEKRYPFGGGVSLVLVRSDIPFQELAITSI